MTQRIAVLSLLLLAGIPVFTGTITLTNGTTLTGTVLARTNGRILIHDPLVGRISVDETAIKKQRNPKRGDLSLKAAFFAGLNLSHGNSSLFGFRFDTPVNRNRLLIDQETLALSGRLQEEEQTLSDRYGSAVLRYGRSFTKDLYGFLRAALTHDRTGGVEIRIQPTGGAGYWFLDTPTLKSFVEAGVGWQYTDFTHAESFTGGVMQFRFLLEWAPSSHIKLQSDHYLFPRLDDPGSARYEIQTTLTIGNSRKGAMTVKYDITLDQNAPAGTRTVSGNLYLGISFRP